MNSKIVEHGALMMMMAPNSMRTVNNVNFENDIWNAKLREMPNGFEGARDVIILVRVR